MSARLNAEATTDVVRHALQSDTSRPRAVSIQITLTVIRNRNNNNSSDIIIVITIIIIVTIIIMMIIIIVIVGVVAAAATTRALNTCNSRN